jgi:hypothetical protein
MASDLLYISQIVVYNPIGNKPLELAVYPLIVATAAVALPTRSDVARLARRLWAI